MSKKKQQDAVKLQKQREKQLRRCRKAVKKCEKESISRRAPVSCARCAYFRPEFKYRSCMFARCPYGKDVDAFQRMRYDPRTGKKVVKLHV